MVLYHRDHRPANGDRRAIEGVDEMRPFFPFDFIACIQSARLIVGAVAGAGHFSVFAIFASARYSTFIPNDKKWMLFGDESRVPGRLHARRKPEWYRAIAWPFIIAKRFGPLLNR